MGEASEEGPREILVVDDSAALREMYTLLLTDAGYSVRTAASGEEALECVRQKRPDLLIVDVIMPGMGGLELLMHLRSDFAPPIPPAIVCSGFDLTEEEAMRAGALLFLPKPFEPDDLLTFVAFALRGELPDEAVTAAQREHITAARRRANEAATAELTRMALSIGDDAGPVLAWCAEYFSLRSGLIVLLRDSRLEVIGTSNPGAFDLGLPVEDWLPFCAQIVETGSSLFLADVALHPSFSSQASVLRGVRSFAGVPLCTSEEIAIGVLCLLGDAPVPLSAEDAYLIELLGRLGSRLLLQHEPLERLPGVPLTQTPGLLEPETFSSFLDMELRLFGRLGGSLDLAVFELPPEEIVDCIALCQEALGRERLGLGLLGAGRLALFQRRPSAAPDASTLLIERLERSVPGLGVGMVTLATPHAALGAQELLHMATQVLERGRPGPVRVAIRAEPFVGSAQG